MKISLIKKEIKNQLFESLFTLDDVISVTLVGSFVDKNDLSGISDIDTVVICNELNENLFNKCIKSVKKINLNKCGLNTYSIKINTTFGPLKFDEKNIVVIHLMIYDVSSHIKHVTSSPFTCFDWERSKENIGLNLKNIYPVGVLQFRDFMSTRRSLDNYLHNLNNGEISFREYSFKNKTISEIKKHKLLDNRHKGEFAYHIIKHLITNYKKLCKANNVSLSDDFILKEIKTFFPKNLNSINKFKKIAKIKSKRGKIFPEYTIDFTRKFINNFEKTIFNDWENAISIFFIRHYKTELNDGSFLGQGRNPSIKNTRKKIKLDEIDNIYCSPMSRTIETAKKVSKKNNIIKDQRLNEIDYGMAEGLQYKELRIKFPDIIKKWDKGEDPHFPNGENTHDVSTRLTSFLVYLTNEIKKKKSKRICIITHNVVLKCLLGRFLKINEKDWYKLMIPHGVPLEFILKDEYYYPNIDRTILYNIQKNITLQ